jgi:YesN/AraC family two-component response regulator
MLRASDDPWNQQEGTLMTPTWKQKLIELLDRIFPELKEQPEQKKQEPEISLRERIERCERLSEEAQQHAEQAAYHIDTEEGKLPARKLAEVSRLLYAESFEVWVLTKDP